MADATPVTTLVAAPTVMVDVTLVDTPVRWVVALAAPPVTVLVTAVAVTLLVAAAPPVTTLVETPTTVPGTPTITVTVVAGAHVAAPDAALDVRISVVVATLATTVVTGEPTVVKIVAAGNVLVDAMLVSVTLPPTGMVVVAGASIEKVPI